MKKVIFDVDGVLLSEERYFDVSALTVWEWLYSPKWMGLPAERDDFDPLNVTEGQTAAIRRVVWGADTLLQWLKERGINSNWDMVHADLVTVIWLLAREYKRRTGDIPSLSFHTEKDVIQAGHLFMGLPIPSAKDVLACWQESVSPGVMGEQVFSDMTKAIEKEFGQKVGWAFLRSDFWQLHMKAFQEWYLGDDVYIQVFHQAPYSGGKEGFLKKEVPLAPAEAVKALFQRLKAAGYELAVATGRARAEVEIPFRQFRWLEEFDPLFLATASDADEAAAMYPGGSLDKPHPFTYECALYGRIPEQYGAYAREEKKAGPEDIVWVVGDSYSDIVGARSANLSFVGVLTGLEGKKAAALFEREQMPFVNRVTDIECII